VVVYGGEVVCDERGGGVVVDGVDESADVGVDGAGVVDGDDGVFVGVSDGSGAFGSDGFGEGVGGRVDGHVGDGGAGG